ncbi:MAG: hypothetical protein Q9181_007431 [Wetmoreana brouardii]
MHLISLLAGSFMVVSHVLGGPVGFKDGQEIAAEIDTILQPRDTGYFMGFQTVYSDRIESRPVNSIYEVQGMSNDINKGFGGLCVISRICSSPHIQVPIARLTLSHLLPKTNITDHRYVWLVPQYTYDIQRAAHAIWFSTSSEWNLRTDNLAKGTKGASRYINWSNNDYPRAQTTERVTAVALFRSWSSWSSPPQGFQRMTTDINAGRGGDYLYILYNI